MTQQAHYVSIMSGLSVEEAQDKLDAGYVYDRTGPTGVFRKPSEMPAPDRWEKHAEEIRATY